MTSRSPAPRLELVQDAHEVKRVMTTISCTDVDQLPKVEGAGTIFEHDGLSVQKMHNGILIEEGCYGGQWMTEIIRSLHGHHEPQEELVFDTLIHRLAGVEAPTMIEFGCFWTYYGLWFAQELQGSKVIGLEPDPHNIEVGKLNARLNNRVDQIEFIRGAIGAEPGSTFEFVAESDGSPYTVAQFDLDSLMQQTGLDHVDLVLADVQGAETLLLERAKSTLAAGKVRFLIVSTHHNSISGSALTHQNALKLLRETGAHIIAEHSVSESFSGDGLIAAAFHEADKDLSIHVSFARSKDTIFDEVEIELAAANEKARIARHEMDMLARSRSWRITAPLRAVFRRR